MKGLAPLFLGIFGTFAFSWVGLTMIPNWQIGHLDPQMEEDGTDVYPQPQSGMVKRGARVYAANGCIYCHSQQVRADYAGADIWKYFDEDLSDDIDKDAQNTLFIITDGYMDFEHTAGRLSQEHRYTSCSQIINTLKKQPDWNTKFQKDDYGLLPVGKKFPNLKVILLELNPRDDWSGEYTLMTDIWSKWFKEMDINSYSFVKDENIEEINERIEKLMQVKLISNSQPVSWTPVKDIDTVLAAAWARDTTHASFKKKDFTLQSKITDTSNIKEKLVTKKDPPVKHSIKRKDEMSFGPVF